MIKYLSIFQNVCNQQLCCCKWLMATFVLWCTSDKTEVTQYSRPPFRVVVTFWKSTTLSENNLKWNDHPSVKYDIDTIIPVLHSSTLLTHDGRLARPPAPVGMQDYNSLAYFPHLFSARWTQITALKKAIPNCPHLPTQDLNSGLH